jgi:hypothetical protein
LIHARSSVGSSIHAKRATSTGNLGQNAFGDHQMPDRIDTSVDCEGYRRTLNSPDADKPPSNSEIERGTIPVHPYIRPP